MMGQGSAEAPGAVGQPLFATTHWSVVLAAAGEGSPQSAAALEELCRSYWQPLYVYIRCRGYRREDAQDLTQEFLAEFISKGGVGLADPARGRFRNFLLKSLQHFLSDEWKRTHRVKRGGGSVAISLNALAAAERYCVEITETMTPERAYERHWAMTLLEDVLVSMQRDHAQAGKAELFAKLQGFLFGPDGPAPYPQIAAALGLSEGAARVAVHRLREQYRQRLRARVAQIVSDPSEIDEELRFLIEVMS